MSKLFGLISLLFIFNSSVFAHEFFLSIAKIEYNETAQTFEVAIKLTAHDYEAVVEDMGFGNLHLGEENESPKTDAILRKYLLSELRIEVNGIGLSPDLIGKEISNDDELWIYVEFHMTPGTIIEEIEIRNTLLMDEFPKQQNHNHLKINEDSFALVCTKERSSGIIYSVKNKDD